MIERLPNGTKVTWSSQGSGREKTKTGIIRAFVPKNAGGLHPDMKAVNEYLNGIPSSRKKFDVRYGVRDCYLVEVPRPRGKRGQDCGVDVYKPLCSQVVVVKES